MTGISLVDSFDMCIFEFFGNIQSDALTHIADLFTMDGNIYLLIVILLLAVLCINRRTRRIGLTIVLALLIGALITNVALKPLVQRARPYILLSENPVFMKWFYAAGAGPVADASYSFPSGHMTSFTAAATVLFIFHFTSKRNPAKIAAWVFPVLAFLSGCSRIYLMVHYATDIIAGAGVGIVAGAAAYAIAKLLYGKIKARLEKPI